MDINKVDYYDWFNGEEGDNMKYLWLADKETIGQKKNSRRAE